MKQYKYILLDWDGNLARTLDIWLAALKVPLEKRGHNFTDKQIGGNFVLFEERMKAMGIDDAEAMVAEANEIATREIPQVKLYSEAVATLENLRKASKKIALVTTSCHDPIDQLLEKHKIKAFFDAVVCGDDVSYHKPHHEPIEKALELLGGNVQEAVMVGDSESDILSAHSAGIDSILFFPPEHATFYDINKLKALKPTHIIEDFRDIIQIAA